MYPKEPDYDKKMETKNVTISFPPQHQNRQPGLESEMNPQPISDNHDYKGSQKLENKVAIISGGDSGIGRAVSIAFAKEGADVVIAYFNERDDAEETKRRVEEVGQSCVLIETDLKEEANAIDVVKTTIDKYGKIDILVNNCAVQFPQNSLLDITSEQFDYTFKTNIYSYFFLTKAALQYMYKGSSIINTTSITAYKGHKTLLDYSSTKGAITSFTRSLALSLAEQGIRVNGVAPGPIWTPLITATFDPDKVSKFGTNTPMKRAGQPFELAPAYVYLASDDSMYMSGQVLHINGGNITES